MRQNKMLNLLTYKNTSFIPGKLNIWPHQYQAKRLIINSMIRIKEDDVTTINASNLTLGEVDVETARIFLNQNHLSGYTDSSYRYGLSDETGLLYLVTLGHSKYATNFSLEILRISTKMNINVLGGFEKILSHIKKIHHGTILVYTDLLIDDGEMLKELNFEPIGCTPKEYFWEKDNEIVNGLRTQKYKILSILGDDADLTKSESFLMMQAGYNKVFDLGYQRWKFKIDDDFEKVDHLKFHYVYKITRPEIDKCFYIGVHSTKNISDNYLGSGNLIVSSVRKYGKEKHKKEIIKIFETRQEAISYEKELVTKELIDDENCLNLSLGGGNIFMPNGTTTGKIWVWNPITGKEMFIEESWSNKIIESGWAKGRNPKTHNLNGSWYISKEGKVGRTIKDFPEGATPGRPACTPNYRWVTRNGTQTLVKEIQDGDEVGFKQCKTNKGLRKIVKDGVTSLVSAEEEAKLLKEGASKPKPPTLGKIGMRSPDGVKKLVSPSEARVLVKEGWSLAAKSLKGVSPAVRELAQELGLRVPKKKHNLS